MDMELYISGIRYAVASFEAAETRVSLLDPFQGVLQPARPVDGALEEELLGLTRMEFSTMGQRLREAQAHISAGAERFTLSSGAAYQKKDDGHYIQRHVKFPVDLIVQDRQIVGVQTPSRESVSILIDPVWKHLTVLPQWERAYPNPPLAVEPVFTARVPMRDGVKLATDIWLPTGAVRPLPCVFIRTPYGRQNSGNSYRRFVQRGYAVVIQDVRGRSGSEGDWEPLTCETEDGSDTLDWIAAQFWCDGNIGMIGGSYLGYVQWAAAASGNPHLKALVSEVAAGSAFVDMPRRGGTLSSGMLAWAFAVSQKETNLSRMERDDWEQVLAHRPLAEVCEKALGYDIPFWRQWLRHTCDDAYWNRGNWYQRALDQGGVKVPALIMSGWFDDNGMGTTQALELTKEYPAGRRKVILGPWMHSGNANYDLHGVDMGTNALRYDLDLAYFLWFERYLRGVENGYDKTAPVEYFTLGENRWKEAQCWPPETTRETALYLGGGQANTSDGGGLLLPSCPMAAGADTLVYDPSDPATHLIDVSENELEIPEDYTQEERRRDYLCYTTAPLAECLTITGDAVVELFVSSDAPDTDLVVRLTQVDADGRSIKLADGILDLKFREGFGREAFLEPDQVYPVRIHTTKLSACFHAGQRLRLTVTSSAKNLAFPNSNTEAGLASAELRVARNTLHHGGAFPARLVFRQEMP